MDNLKEKLITAYDKILTSNNILIIAHKQPDGDALSSASTMSLLLDGLSKKYTLFSIDTPQASFSFLPNIHKFTTNINNSFQNFDLIIVLDCGNSNRTGIADKLKLEKNQSQYIIEFDHHRKIEDYANLEIRLTNRSSTAEIIYLFLKENSIFINDKMANTLLTGILTDTANFLYPSANQATLDISSNLISYGASLPKITKKTWNNESISSMKILGKILNNLEINKTHKIAFTVLTYKEVKKLKENFSNEEDIFNKINGFLSNIQNTKAVLFIREEEYGEIKGSLRTNDEKVEVIGLARLLGGGGHPRACGFNVNGHIIKTGNNWKII